MKKYKKKKKYLKEQSDYWKLLKGRNVNNKAFENRCEIYCNAVEADLKHYTDLNNFVENNYRS